MSAQSTTTHTVPVPWEQFCRFFLEDPDTGLSFDFSRCDLTDSFLDSMSSAARKAFLDMEALERGEIANPDENRMVGHYWLRAPQLAPTAQITADITNTLQQIKEFSAAIHDGTISPSDNARFDQVLSIGIGGSALGPQLISHALQSPDDPMRLHFLDNTDPDGFELVFSQLRPHLQRTLIIVISKSGGTPETLNGMLATQKLFQAEGVEFSSRAIAVTGSGSKLDIRAEQEKWLRRFPMWDWVGGRTSVTSAVGLLPAALQGIDIDAFLRGAADMDRLTRRDSILTNPAMMMALSWYKATDGKGKKDLVILPYKDRLALMSRYLQQLLMESLGKEKNLKGEIVNQGLTVYGNKGSTDQHAYVQQLRDGLHNFFVTFIVVLQSSSQGKDPILQNNATAGDYLSGFWQGTRQALTEKGRASITLTLPEVSPYHIGALIALYERTVGFYASLIGINAYHQPGVEAGKKAAASVLNLQKQVESQLDSTPRTAEEIAAQLDPPASPEHVFHICRHLAATRSYVIKTGYGTEASYRRL